MAASYFCILPSDWPNRSIHVQLYEHMVSHGLYDHGLFNGRKEFDKNLAPIVKKPCRFHT